jgi:uncharacterized protein YjiS (DUF1127 family)
MMTKPIGRFRILTSETTPAWFNELTRIGFTFDDHRPVERRARYARAAMIANLFVEALLWAGRQSNRLLQALKADFKLRAAEAQLFRMSDRELADLGLTRADIPFAVREAAGVEPHFDAAPIHGAPANQNLRHAA